MVVENMSHSSELVSYSVVLLYVFFKVEFSDLDALQCDVSVIKTLCNDMITN